MRFKPRFFIIIAVLILIIIAAAVSCSSKNASVSAKDISSENSVPSAVKPSASDSTENEETEAESPEGSAENGDAQASSDQTASKPMTKTPESAYPLDAPDDDYLVLVNKTHHLTENYYPDDMVTVSSCVEGVGTNETRKMRKVAADALEELIAGAAQDGYRIAMRTGFRSYSYQKNLFASYASKNGEEAANRYSAKAGQSEHQTGLCCDVSSPSVGWALSYSYGETEEGKWLEENAHRFGFIIRYKKEKEDITGYVYEPWHIRYVGKEAAEIIYNEDITFEEYLGILN